MDAPHGPFGPLTSHVTPRPSRPSALRGVTWRVVDRNYCGPFDGIPLTAEVEGEIERQRAIGSRALERYLTRLELTCKAARGNALPHHAREPHNANAVRALIRSERAKLDAEHAAAASDPLHLARWLLSLPEVTDKESFGEAARREGIGGDGDKNPGAALWKRVQRAGHEALGDSRLPERYSRFEGFGALVSDLIAGEVRPRDTEAPESG